VLHLLSVVAFFAAVFVCPPAMVLGLGGVVLALLRRSLRRGAEPPA